MNVRNLRNPRLALLTAAAIVAGGAVVYAVYAQATQKHLMHATAQPTVSGGPALLVEAVTVQAQSVQTENALSGEVTPYRLATVSAEIGRRIVSRPILQGDRVAQGSLLAALDSEQARVALDQARATLAQA